MIRPPFLSLATFAQTFYLNFSVDDHGNAVSVEALPVQGTTPSQQAFDEDWLRNASRYRTREELLYDVRHNEAGLFKEFWEIPMNYAGKLDIPIGGIAAKNRYQTILPSKYPVCFP